MLGDVDRVDGYRRAIEAVVRPGDVVVDLGSGTGILSVFAARAGARRVYAIEERDIIDVSRTLIAETPYRDVIRLISSRAEKAVLPERAHVAITETLGNDLLDEDIEGLMRTARERLLVPGAREIPRELSLSAIPIEVPDEIRRRIDIEPIEGFDVARFSRALQCEAINARLTDIHEQAALAPAAVLWRAPVGSSPPNGSARWEVRRAGTFAALGLLIGAELAPGISIGTRLGRTSNWTMPVLPITGMPVVEAGDVIEATIDCDRSGVTSWRSVWSRRGKRLGETVQSKALQRRILRLPEPTDHEGLRTRLRSLLRRFLR
jgi:predicted RNA methylase